MKGIYLTAIGLCFASGAAAQNCQSYVGQVVPLLTFEEAIERLPKIQGKGEFETTAEYEARRSAALAAGGPGFLIVEKEPEDRKYIQYDADQQRFAIISYAFDNTGFGAWDAMYGTPYASYLKPSTMGNIDVVIGMSEKVTGTYESQNSYGAKATIEKISRQISVIFDRHTDYKTDGISSGLFPSAKDAPYAAGYVAVPSSEAPRLKSEIKLGFVVQPREPFIIRNSYSVGKTTIRNPTEVTENATILVGDIQCGLVLDGKKQVLGAFETR